MYSIWRQHVLLILCFATWAFFATSGSVSAQDEANGFSQQLEALALKCDELGLKHQAEITRQWIVPARPDQQRWFGSGLAGLLRPGDVPKRYRTEPERAIRKYIDTSG